jgi:O-antigen/teichoic acid export membrane protein
VTTTDVASAPRRPSFGSLVGRYVVADGLANLLGVAGVVVAVRVLDVAQFGAADWLRTVQWFLASIAGLGVVEGASRFYFETPDPAERRVILGIARTARVVGGVIAAAVLVLLRPLDAIPGAAGGAAVWWAALTIPASSLLEVQLQTAINTSAGRQYGALVTTNAALSFGAICVLLLGMGWGLEGYFLALLIGALAAVALGSLLQRGDYARTFRRREYRRYVALGAPFTVTMFMQYGFGLLVRSLLLRAGMPVALGWYGFAERGQLAIKLVVGAVGKVWIPRMLADNPEGGADVSARVRALNAFVLAFTATAIVFLDEMIHVIGGAAYAPAYWPTLLLALAAWIYFIGDWIVSVSLYVGKRPQHRIWIFAIAYGAGVIVALRAVPAAGAIGAAAAMLAAYIVMTVAMVIVTRRVHPLGYGLGHVVPRSLGVLALATWGSAQPSLAVKIAVALACVGAMRMLGLLPIGRGARAAEGV